MIIPKVHGIHLLAYWSLDMVDGSMSMYFEQNDSKLRKMAKNVWLCILYLHLIVEKINFILEKCIGGTNSSLHYLISDSSSTRHHAEKTMLILPAPSSLSK